MSAQSEYIDKIDLKINKNKKHERSRAEILKSIKKNK